MLEALREACVYERASYDAHVRDVDPDDALVVCAMRRAHGEAVRRPCLSALLEAFGDPTQAIWQIDYNHCDVVAELTFLFTPPSTCSRRGQACCERAVREQAPHAHVATLIMRMNMGMDMCMCMYMWVAHLRY